MDDQERNREALIEHIAEQDRIIRRRNQQIGELQAINFALQGDLQGQPLTPSEALIERAEKAEKERDEAREVCQRAGDDAAEAKRARDYYHELSKSYLRQRNVARGLADTAETRAGRAEQALTEIAQGGALTPDDIADEMVKRLHGALAEAPGWRVGPMYEEGPILRRALAIALTEPPARPEGAERFDPVVDAAIRGHSDITSPDVVRAISDAIAEEVNR